MIINGKFHIIWRIEDVRARAEKEYGLSLTDAECFTVLQKLDKEHDCSLGISWNDLDTIVYTLFYKKQENNSMQE